MLTLLTQGVYSLGMTQTSTPQMTWTEPRRDKYGRPRIELYATVQRDGADKPGWGCQVVVTTMPKSWTETRPEARYMVTNWMEAPFDADGNRKPGPKHYAKRAEAKAAAEALVAEQLAKAPAIEQAAEAAESTRLWA